MEDIQSGGIPLWSYEWRTAGASCPKLLSNPGVACSSSILMTGRNRDKGLGSWCCPSLQNSPNSPDLGLSNFLYSAWPCPVTKAGWTGWSPDLIWASLSGKQEWHGTYSWATLALEPQVYMELGSQVATIEWNLQRSGGAEEKRLRKEEVCRKNRIFLPREAEMRGQASPQIKRQKEELAGDFPVAIMTSCISSNRLHKIFLHPSNKFFIAKASLSEDLFLEINWSFRLGCKIWYHREKITPQFTGVLESLPILGIWFLGRGCSRSKILSSSDMPSCCKFHQEGAMPLG